MSFIGDLNTANFSSALQFWSDNATPFSGYLLLALSLPAGYTTAQMDPKFPRQRIPTRIKVPIVNGMYDQQTLVLYNSSITPPNTQYVAYWYDPNDTLISGPSVLFTVSNPVVVLPTPTLTLPTVSGSIPLPGTLP